MNRLLSSVSLCAVAAATVLAAPAVRAADTLVVSGETLTSTVTLSGTDTLTVEQGGTVDAADDDGVIWNGASTGVVIDNAGVITTSAPDARAIDTGGNAGTVPRVISIFNGETGQILGLNDGIRINNNYEGAEVTVENHGLIASESGQAFDFAALEDAAFITIDNYGTVRSQTADAMRPGAGAVVTNYGTIEAQDLTSDGDGVDFQDFGGTVVNKSGAVIIGAKHGITGDGAVTVTNEADGLIVGSNGSGVNIDNSGDTVVNVTNYGTIRGEVTGNIDNDGDPDGVPDGDGDGIDVDGQLVLHNYGYVQGLGASGTNDGVPNTADGLAIGGGTIYNYESGVIEAFDLYGDGKGRAILVDDSNGGAAPFATTLVNYGIVGSDGVVVTFVGAQDDTIENYGQILALGGGQAIDMGGGDDRFVYGFGSTVTGYVAAGDGFDTFAIQDSGTFALGLLGEAATYRGFETFEIDAGAAVTATGATGFAGTVAISGSLLTDGSLASANAMIFEGGRLGGNGTFGSLAVEEGGTLAPGQSIGTVTTTGDVLFAPGSFYEVEIDTVSSDLVSAGGAGLVEGGTVVLQPAPGPYFIGTSYTILEAEAGIDGPGFDGVSSPFLFIDPELSTFPDSVTLTLTRNDRAFADLAVTRNQAAVAWAIEAADFDTALYANLVGATDPNAVRVSYDLLSGEAHASLGTVLFGQNALVNDTLIGRLRQAPPSASATTAALGFGGPVTAYATKAPEPAAFKGVAPAPAAGPVYAAWAQAFGQWSSADGNGNAADVDGSLGGFLAGADVTAGNVVIGLAGGYSAAQSDVDDRRSSADADTAMIAAYAGAAFDALKLRGGASYGWSDIDTKRTAIVGEVIEHPYASYDGSTASLFAEAAYAFEAAGAAFEPYAQIAWSWVETDGFTETNAPVTGLTSGGLDFNTAYSTLGLRAAASMAFAGGSATPFASLGWRHAFGDVTPEIAALFLDTGTGFSVAGAPVAEDSLVLGAGVDVAVGASVVIGLAYEGQFGDDVSYNAIRGGLTYRF